MGVRNTFYSAFTQDIPKDKHRCFKNWDTSSSEMETDSINLDFLFEKTNKKKTAYVLNYNKMHKIYHMQLEQVVQYSPNKYRLSNICMNCVYIIKMLANII